jgi:hypothetical protein
MGNGRLPEDAHPDDEPERMNRAYKHSDLPVVSPTPVGKEDNVGRELLLKELEETAAAWRMLTDVRFKLLALLPPIAALGLVATVSPKGALEGTSTPARVALAAFGTAVTLGLFVYDRRNSVLYDGLISRGRRAEFELGVDTGVFRGREKPRVVPIKGMFAKRFFRVVRVLEDDSPGISLVKHDVALGLVYGAVLLAWLLAGLSVAFGWVETTVEP